MVTEVKNTFNSYGQSIKRAQFYFWIFIVMALASCNKEPADTINSQKIYTYCHKLSAVSADKNGYWIGDENGDVYFVRGMKRQCYQTGLDKIYDVMRDSRDSTVLWIASRNSGVQKWQFQADSLHLYKTYLIPNKGMHYSPYDIQRVHDHLFVATSQGLFEVPSTVDTAQVLRPIYSLENKNDLPAAPITHLAVMGDRYIYAKVEKGLLRYDVVLKKKDILYSGISFRQVYESKHVLYALSDGMLVELSADGMKQKEYPLDFKALNYSRYAGTHIFLTPSAVYFSNDMLHFKIFNLRNDVNAQAYNTILPDDGNNYSVVIAGANEYRLPHHFNTMGNGGNLQMIEQDGNSIYIANKSGQIYITTPNSQKAQEVVQLKREHLPVAASVINHAIYYVTATNQLYCLKLHDSFLANQIMSRSKLLLQIATHVTAMTALPSQKRVLIGIQDELLSLDVVSNRIDTIKAMHGKYITSFYTVPETNDTYISTLNDGVFYYSSEGIHKIEAVGNQSFINAVVVTKGYDSQMYLLYNHQIVTRLGKSTEARGHKKMLLVGDSLLFTIPEQGLRSYAIQGGTVKKRKLLYSDISFEPSACVLIAGKLYLGSNLGVMMVTPGKEDEAKWIHFYEHTISVWAILDILLFGIFILFTYYIYRRSKRRGETTQLRLQVEDLQKRLSGLNIMVEDLSAAETERLKRIEGQLQQVDVTTTHWKEAYQLLARLSSEVARLNQDVVLQIVKGQEQQIERIKSLNYYDSKRYIADSLKAQESGEVDRIIDQFCCNKLWLDRVTKIQARMQQIETHFQDALVIYGVNGELMSLLSHWRDDVREKSLDDLEAYFAEINELVDKVQSEASQELIVNYIDKRERFLMKRKTYSHMAEILLKQLRNYRETVSEIDKVYLLRQLHPIELRMQQMEALHRLRKLMRAYVEDEDTSKENVARISQLIESFFAISQQVDAIVIEDILHFTTSASQQVKVLTILLADKKVKRTLIPGMLGIYGNLNPVISRIYHSKIGENREALLNYQQQHPESIVYYLLQLVE